MGGYFPLSRAHFALSQGHPWVGCTLVGTAVLGHQQWNMVLSGLMTDLTSPRVLLGGGANLRPLILLPLGNLPRESFVTLDPAVPDFSGLTPAKFPLLCLRWL